MGWNAVVCTSLIVAIALLGGINFQLPTPKNVVSFVLDCNIFLTPNMSSSSDITVNQITGEGGLELFSLEHSSGTTAQVYSHGATMTSCKTSTGRELLFVSKNAVFNGASPIRGGIPLIFPIFGDGWGTDTVPKGLLGHGFARRSQWKFEVVDGKPCFLLTPKELTPEYVESFPFDFTLRYEITLSAEGFSTAMYITNVGNTPFAFQALFHTYYNVDAIEPVTVTGLKGTSYINKLAEQPWVTADDRDKLTITEETDAIYMDLKNAGPISLGGISATSPSANIDVEFTTSDHARHCVVWNPWVAKSKKMGDFGDEEYHKMICVEPGHVLGYKTIAGGETWKMDQTVALSGYKL
eukprot:m.57052 g.57052  ORF g.57052 m.57052 type:complete len:353 (+) comp22332_c0_seq1:85-1143(+)